MKHEKYKNIDYTNLISEINKYIKQNGLYPTPREVMQMDNGRIDSWYHLYNVFYHCNPEMLKLKDAEYDAKESKALKKFATEFKKNPQSLEVIRGTNKHIYTLLRRFYGKAEGGILQNFVNDFIDSPLYESNVPNEKIKELRFFADVYKLKNGNTITLHIKKGTRNQQNVTKRIRYFLKKSVDGELTTAECKRILEQKFNADVEINQ